MLIILSVLLALVIFASLEFAHRSVYGGMIDEKELDVFFGKHLDSYHINEFATNDWMFAADLGKRDLPYLARAAWTLNTWYIKDYGTIPRWSKWSKALDERYVELTNKGEGVKDIVPLSKL